jgi:hypothetical protein
MKKLTNSTTSQVKACPPPMAMAMAPMVSTTTMAEMRKKIVSSRVSSRRSLARSACPVLADVSSSGWTVATGSPPFGTVPALQYKLRRHTPPPCRGQHRRPACDRA